MRLVDDRIGPRDRGEAIVAPVEGLVGDNGFEGAGSAVATIE